MIIQTDIYGWATEHGPVVLSVLGIGLGIMSKINKLTTLMTEYPLHAHIEDTALAPESRMLKVGGLRYPTKAKRED